MMSSGRTDICRIQLQMDVREKPGTTEAEI